MASRSAKLLSNVSVVAAGSWVTFNGGRASLLIMAATYPTTTKLQVMGQDGTTAIDVATVTANGKTDYDLPAGSYRMSLAGGTVAGMYADLVSVSYT